MVRVSRGAVVLALVCGCALPTGGLSADFDAGPGGTDAAADGGARDTSTPDTSVRDTGVADTGTADTGLVDTGVDDSGLSCSGADHCEGETRVVCDMGTPRRQVCTALSAYCDDSSGAPLCVEWVCTPNASSCSSTTEETRCDARGVSETLLDCARGCDATTGACRPEKPCELTVDGTITTGRITLDNCSGGDDATPVTGCTRVDISGGDRILRLDVPVANTYRIDFNDVAGGADLDALVYLRTACADRGSELACNDDRPGTRNSRIELHLEPGEYFIILDSFRDTDESEPGRCAPGELDVSIR